MDALSSGRRIKSLTGVDDFTKDCLMLSVAFGILDLQLLAEPKKPITTAIGRGFRLMTKSWPGPLSNKVSAINGLTAMLKEPSSQQYQI
ncbi:hypothetical protein M2387_004881 [Klebsiella sp. BIGb0407]|nr:hypothetical protein [Klebsiella sp. BIGb0407]